jgi:hypothetical protein
MYVNGKVRPVETIPGIAWGWRVLGGIKGEWWRG